MITEDLLTELNTLGVPFLATDKRSDNLQLSPANLLAGLASDPDARVQLAIIVLLLVRPDYATMHDKLPLGCHLHPVYYS